MTTPHRFSPAPWLPGAGAGVALLALLLGTACASHRVLVPPRLDLARHERVGLVTFTIENAKGSLNQLATERFAEEILDAQPGVEVLELGEAEVLLDGGEQPDLTPAAIRAIGAEHGVPAVFVGHLKVSDVKPSGGVVALRFPFVEATVSVELTVRLVSSESGGTMWRASGAASEKVGQVGLSDGVPYFSAENPNDAYGRLVDVLVLHVSRDLRPTWRKQ